MKLIIAGSRKFQFDIGTIQNFIDALIPMNIVVEEVVCGMARGADISGKNWADFQNIPVKKMPADWDNLGRGAGHIRNKQMAEYGDALLLIWDGQSPGSTSMRKYMSDLNKPIYEVILK